MQPGLEGRLCRRFSDLGRLGLYRMLGALVASRPRASRVDLLDLGLNIGVGALVNSVNRGCCIVMLGSLRE